jgi:CheY-like chemotaxis protein
MLYMNGLAKYREGGGEDGRGSGMNTILIVDDEVAVVETLVDLLSSEGFATVTAPNGHLALKQIGTVRPALIVLDNMMPVMDGLQTLRAVRAHPDWKGIPVVFMTAAPMTIATEEILWDAMLAKPFDGEQLMDLVRRMLKRS